jgi:hypothetical protein
MNDSPFEQWRLKHMRGTAASRDIMELLALAFAGGRESRKEWVGLSVEDRADILSRKWWNFEDEFDLEGFLWVTEAKLKEKNSDA